MDISTANRLFEYRKAHGFSQEELAEKIGVSRQAISKWERSESSPDTDNLIALSKLYGVTIDELLNGSEKPKKADNNEDTSDEGNSADVENNSASAEAPKSDSVHVGWDGIHVESKNGDKVHIGGGYGVHVETGDEHWKSFYADDRKKMRPKGKPPKDPLLHATLPIVLIIVYLIIGFTFSRGWAVGWILFLLIPIIETGIAAIKYRNPSYFAYPVFAAAIFLTGGMLFHVWHPTWIIFLTIPIYYLVCDSFRQAKRLKEDDYPDPPANSNGTYYQPEGVDTYSTARRHGSVLGKIIITAICAITIIATVAIICTFSWLKEPFDGSFLSGIANIVDTVTGDYSWWSYENEAAYTVGSGEIAADGITQLSIEWLSHNVTVEYYDGDTIAFSEPEQGNSDHQLRWLLSGNELKIKYCKSGLKWLKNNDFNNKDLTVYLPIGFSFNEIDIETVSGNITLKDVTANIVELETVSGNITAGGEYTDFTAESVSGNISASGSFTYVTSETVSGISEINATTKPTKVECETVSGICRVDVPADISGFSINYETVSGDVLTNDFLVTRPEKRTLVYGDGSLTIEFDSVSGNFEIRKSTK